MLVSLTGVIVYTWGRRFLSPAGLWSRPRWRWLRPPSPTRASSCRRRVPADARPWPRGRSRARSSGRRSQGQGLLSLAIVAGAADAAAGGRAVPVAVSAVLLDAGLAHDRRRLAPWLPRRRPSSSSAPAGVRALASAPAPGAPRSAPTGRRRRLVRRRPRGRASSPGTRRTSSSSAGCAARRARRSRRRGRGRRLRGAPERALVAVSLSLASGWCSQVGVFASKYVAT